MPAEATTARVPRRHRPTPGFVPRARVVRRLLEAQAPIALIVAPAGYGKSALLAEWATRDERPFKSLPLTAMDAAGARPALAEATAGAGATVIVVEDAHRAAPAAVRALLEGACLLPTGSTLALASRAWPGTPAGRLRTQRRLVEVGVQELAMSRLEAAMLLDAAGVRIDGPQLDRLLATTEGWAAALALAARALRDAEDLDAAIDAFGGGDRTVTDYLRDELLDACSGEERTLLRRTSILRTLTPGACDAVLQTPGSGGIVAALARRGLPLTPLDGRELEFRPHPLLAQTLRTELAREEPELAGRLHRRAARWYARHQEPAGALQHAWAGRDGALAGRILWPLAVTGEPLGHHLAAFDERTLCADPRLALTAAVHHLSAGQGSAAARVTEAAARALGTDEHPAIALLRACTARDSLTTMAADAARARELLPPDSAWHALALLLDAVAAQLRGVAPAAVRGNAGYARVASVGATPRERLEDAAALAAERLPVVAALAHAQLALLAADADDWDEAAHQAQRAHASLPGAAPDAVSALVLTACAVAAAQHGDIAQARHDAVDAERILDAQPDFAPWLLAEAQTWLARARILLSDGPSARRLLARAARAQARVPDACVLAGWIHAGWARADAFAETATGDGPMLTNAELRVLRLLPSHMSFREIGERLHVSTNTVKTQALAVYRKLDVCCRSDAVARGRSAGLIGDA